MSGVNHGDEYPQNPWARYADDGVIHCNSMEEAEAILKSLEKRLSEVDLKIHPEKKRIVYCKKENRNGSHTHDREMKLQFRTSQEPTDLSKALNPKIRG